MNFPPLRAIIEDEDFCTIIWRNNMEIGITEKNPPENPAEKDPEKDPERISKNQKRILDLMQSNPYITQEELSKEIGINAKNIQKLKTAGLLSRIGPDKGGYWQVTEKKE